MQHRSAVLELTGSSSSRTSVSPVVLLKLLVLDEEREMFGRLLLQSFSLANGLWRKRKVDKLSLEYTTVNPQNYFCVMWDMEETVKIYCCKQLFFFCPPHLSLLGQISGELGLDDVSDFTSWDSGQVSVGFWSLQKRKYILIFTHNKNR